MLPPQSFRKRILIELFNDFQAKNVSHEDLRGGYQGMSLKELELKLAGDSHRVSYSIAFGDLIKESLIKTGPRVPFNKRLASGMAHIGLEDRKEYVCITEEGLKYYFSKFKKDKSEKGDSRPVSINNSSFYNSPIGIGENINQAVSISESGENLINQLLDLLKKEKGSITSEDEQEIRSIVQDVELEERPSKIKQRLNSVFNFAKEGTIAVAWNLVASVISGKLSL